MSQKKVLLEVKLPQETFKSPAAMELVFNSLLQTGGESTPVQRYWEGKARPWVSLEITSIDGEIRFFVWAFANQKDFLSANFYSQYPDITIREVPDYTTAVTHNIDKYDFYACEYRFIKPDSYPIKTYVEYGLSDDPDEELKVDPLSAFIEVLGSIKKEDQIWYQFIVRAHVAEKTIFNGSHPDKWLEGAKDEVKKILEETIIEDKDGNKTPNLTKLSESKKDLIKSIEKSVSTFGLDVGIRAINFIPKGRGGLSIGILKGGFRQFGSNSLNGLRPSGPEPDYPWQDSRGKGTLHWNLKLIDCYCKRSYFHPPYSDLGSGHISLPIISHFYPHERKLPIMVMSTEELATLYHFPGSAVKTPALHRIPSKRADAPANLPI